MSLHHVDVIVQPVDVITPHADNVIVYGNVIV